MKHEQLSQLLSGVAKLFKIFLNKLKEIRDSQMYWEQNMH